MYVATSIVYSDFECIDYVWYYSLRNFSEKKIERNINTSIGITLENPNLMDSTNLIYY